MKELLSWKHASQSSKNHEKLQDPVQWLIHGLVLQKAERVSLTTEWGCSVCVCVCIWGANQRMKESERRFRTEIFFEKFQVFSVEKMKKLLSLQQHLYLLQGFPSLSGCIWGFRTSKRPKTPLFWPTHLKSGRDWSISCNLWVKWKFERWNEMENVKMMIKLNFLWTGLFPTGGWQLFRAFNHRTHGIFQWWRHFLPGCLRRRPCCRTSVR